MKLSEIQKASDQTLLDLFLQSLQELARELRQEIPTELIQGPDLILANLEPVCGPCTVMSNQLIVKAGVATEVYCHLGGNSQEPWSAGDHNMFVNMSMVLRELQVRMWDGLSLDPEVRLLRALNAIADQLGTNHLDELDKFGPTFERGTTLRTNLIRTFPAFEDVAVNPRGNTIQVPPTYVAVVQKHLGKPGATVKEGLGLPMADFVVAFMTEPDMQPA